MKKILKKQSSIICSIILSCFAAGCTVPDITSIGLQAITSYSCTWSNSANAYFIDPELTLPDITCPEPFYNAELYYNYPANSFYELITMNVVNTEPAYTLTWTASVSTKTCSASSYPSQTLVFTQNDYWGRLFRPSNEDMIECAPLIQGFEITADDIKHELVFQLTGVTNTFDNSIGTITWTKTWEGQNEADFTDAPYNVWEFYFGSEPLKGTYTPNAGYPRYIYMYNQFVYI